MGVRGCGNLFNSYLVGPFNIHRINCFCFRVLSVDEAMKALLRIRRPAPPPPPPYKKSDSKSKSKVKFNVTAKGLLWLIFRIDAFRTKRTPPPPLLKILGLPTLRNRIRLPMESKALFPRVKMATLIKTARHRKRNFGESAVLVTDAGRPSSIDHAGRLHVLFNRQEGRSVDKIPFRLAHGQLIQFRRKLSASDWRLAVCCGLHQIIGNLALCC